MGSKIVDTGAERENPTPIEDGDMGASILISARIGGEDGGKVGGRGGDGDEDEECKTWPHPAPLPCLLYIDTSDLNISKNT